MPQILFIQAVKSTHDTDLMSSGTRTLSYKNTQLERWENFAYILHFETYLSHAETTPKSI